jgi:lipid-A-disaccharide synthase
MSMEVEGPVFISVGEPSGDLYASFLACDMEAKTPGLRIFAVGGKNLVESGVDVLIDYHRMTTLGFTSGVLTAYRNYTIYGKIARLMYRIRPKTFIAVAYPGINLPLCNYAKKLGCRVYYYLPPQIWAWGTFRKYFIKKWVDKVISVFPFEYEFYKKRGIDTIYFKNPLFEGLKNYKRSDFKKRIGLMPGSRKSEVKRNLPVMTELMRRIAQKRNDIEFVLILHSSLIGIGGSCPWFMSLHLASRLDTERKAQLQDKAIITSENRYQAMKNCDLLIVCSGTASLEAAAMDISQIFFNRPSFFDYHVLRRFLKIREYNLTNLYFEEPRVPSFVSTCETYLVDNLLKSFQDTFLIDE